MNIQHFLDNAWRWKCGLPEKDQDLMPSLEELRESEWSETFEGFMRNRLVMGAIRYGKIDGKQKYNRIQSMVRRLVQYTYTGNQEMLVDLANDCMLEFIENNHQDAHFKAIDRK